MGCIGELEEEAIQHRVVIIVDVFNCKRWWWWEGSDGGPEGRGWGDELLKVEGVLCGFEDGGEGKAGGGVSVATRGGAGWWSIWKEAAFGEEGGGGGVAG